MSIDKGDIRFKIIHDAKASEKSCHIHCAARMRADMFEGSLLWLSEEMKQHPHGSLEKDILTDTAGKLRSLQDM